MQRFFFSIFAPNILLKIMKEIYQSAKKQFHKIFAGFFYAWIFLRPVFSFLHFLLVFFLVGKYHFWDLLAIPSSYSAYLILKGKKIGVFLFLLCAVLNFLTRFSFPGIAKENDYFSIPFFIIFIIVLFFRLKKDGKSAWKVLFS